MVEKIREGIFWIGVNNPEGRDFHGIHTPRGGSYNSYFIDDEKPTIIDCTNKKFLDGWMESLKSKINPLEIKYIVINHAEPDHAGAVKEILDECNNAIIVCTEKCKTILVGAFGVDREFNVVAEGDELSLGKNTLQFNMDPMVHWPETMMTYLVNEKMLFSADLFGTEIAHENLFADKMDNYEELSRDYFTIVMRPLYMQVKKAVDKVRSMDVDMICPSHGPVYRKDVEKIIDYYEKMAINPEEDKVLILYYSIWHYSRPLYISIIKEDLN